MDRAVSAISASALLCLFLVISRLLHVSGNAEGMAQLVAHHLCLPCIYGLRKNFHTHLMKKLQLYINCKIVRLKFSVRIEKSHISCIVDAIFNGASAVLRHVCAHVWYYSSVNATWIAFMGFLRSEIDF